MRAGWCVVVLMVAVALTLGCGKKPTEPTTGGGAQAQQSGEQPKGTPGRSDVTPEVEDKLVAAES